MKRVRIGIFGTGRGHGMLDNFLKQDYDVVAICDNRPERRKDIEKTLGKSVAVYDDFDKFIEHGLDAVYLANFFHEHTPYILKCFAKNIHVLCECISNSTMAEGVELIRAAKNTKSIFMLAENYPFMPTNREIKKICDGKTLGKFLFAEGEYNHPGNPFFVAEREKQLHYFPEHWRNYLPRTYYITHSLGPLMYSTGATPKKVSAFAAFAPTKGDVPTANHVGDKASIIMTQNDDGSVFRITGCSAFGAYDHSYRICGDRGQVENLRGMGDRVMLRYSDWSTPEGGSEVSFYEPNNNDDPDKELIRRSGHWGSDFYITRIFLNCIRENKQPPFPFDLHSSVAMSSVGILAHRSVLNGGQVYDIPDFHNEEALKQYENDDATPFYYTDGRKPTIPCCSHPDYTPTEKQLRLYDEKVMGNK